MLAIAGAILLVVQNAQEEPKIELDDLIKLYAKDRFIIFISVIVVLILIMASIIFVLRNHVVHPNKLALLRKDAGSSETPKPDKIELIRYVVHRFCSSALGGALGSTTVLSAKASIGLILTSLGGEQQFDRGESWGLLLWTLASGVAQIYILIRAVGLFDNLFVIPIYYVMWVVCSILGGAAFFGEFDCFADVDFVVLSIAIVIIFSGVALLNYRQPREYFCIDAAAGTEMKEMEDAAAKPPFVSPGTAPSFPPMALLASPTIPPPAFPSNPYLSPQPPVAPSMMSPVPLAPYSPPLPPVPVRDYNLGIGGADSVLHPWNTAQLQPAAPVPFVSASQFQTGGLQH